MDARSELEELRRLDQLERRQAKQQGAPSGLMQGLMDPVAGAGQLVPRALSAVTSLGGTIPNPVSEAYDRSAQRQDQYAQNRERNYQMRREESGADGFDTGRLMGNILNPVNYVGGGAGYAPIMARGALFGATQPVMDTEDYAKTKAIQTGVGAISAGVGKGIGDKAIAPASKRAGEVAALLKEKIPLTPGQMHGGLARAIENKLTSVPLLGDAIKGAQDRTTTALNKSVYSRVLKNIGEKMPKDIDPGREAIDYVGERVGKSYDDLLPKLTGKADDQFLDDLAGIGKMVQADDIMNSSEKSKFNKIIANTIKSRMSGKGITGQAIKDIESELGEKAAKLGKGDVSQQQLADALKETQSALRGMVERSNPSYAEQLKGINKAYAELLRAEKAAGSVGAEGGVFTPSQLQSAVKMMDRSKNRRAFSRGDALLQDLSEPARNVLPNNVPNSGTVDRALAFGLGSAGLYGGGEYTGQDWMKYAGLALAPSLIYTQPGGAVYRGLSKAVGPVGKGLARVAPYAAAPVAVPSLSK